MLTSLAFLTPHIEQNLQFSLRTLPGENALGGWRRGAEFSLRDGSCRLILLECLGAHVAVTVGHLSVGDFEP